MKAKKTATTEPTRLADIFKQAGNQAELARSVVKALGLARNEYERRLVMLELKHFATETDK